jgi:hypothetical protein
MVAAVQNRILHMHIPKAGGTALRLAFEKATKGKMRAFTPWDEREYSSINPDDYDFYSGHFGFKTASRIGGDIIVVFRNPVDRFLSVYYFWRHLYAKGLQMDRNTTLAATYSLDEFVLIRDEPFFLEEFYNRMTFQVAYGYLVDHRRELRDARKTEDEIFQMAMQNLATFAVVGTQERLHEVERQLLSTFGIDLRIDKINVTPARSAAADISLRTLRKIQEWVYIDLELYEQASRLVATKSLPPLR